MVERRRPRASETTAQVSHLADTAKTAKRAGGSAGDASSHGTKAVYQRAGNDVERFMACNNTLMMRSLIRQGVGIGVLSWLDVAADTAQGKLAFVPLHEPHLKPLTLVLAVAPRRQPSRAAREAMKYFESRLLQITHWRTPTPAHQT